MDVDEGSDQNLDLWPLLGTDSIGKFKGEFFDIFKKSFLPKSQNSGPFMYFTQDIFSSLSVEIFDTQTYCLKFTRI